MQLHEPDSPQTGWLIREIPPHETPRARLSTLGCKALSDIVLTPHHRAGGIMDSVVRILNMLADDYEAFLQDKPRKYAITDSFQTACSCGFHQSRA